MPPPKSIKGIQVLTGRLAGLSRFISISAEKSFPFFKIIRKGTRFAWTEKAQQAFEELKKFRAAITNKAGTR